MLCVHHGTSGGLPHSGTQADRQAIICQWPWWRKVKEQVHLTLLTVSLLFKSVTISSPVSVAKASHMGMTVFKGNKEVQCYHVARRKENCNICEHIPS